MSFPDQSNKEQSAGQQQNETVQQGQQSQTDDRQAAIEQEDDTARLRSERKSVEDGSGKGPGE